MAAQRGETRCCKRSVTEVATRFHLPWIWNGAPAMLQSRAADEKGNVQESRSRGPRSIHPRIATTTR